MFSIKYSNQAKKSLRRFDKALVKRLLDKIEKLRENPILHDTKIIEGS